MVADTCSFLQLATMNTAGVVISSSPIVTQDDLDNLESDTAQETELLGGQIAYLNRTKQSVTAASTAIAALSASLQDALRSLAALQLAQGVSASDSIDLTLCVVFSLGCCVVCTETLIDVRRICRRWQQRRQIVTRRVSSTILRP